MDREVSTWFSDVLRHSVRLVTYHESNVRVRNPEILQLPIEVSYADGYPYLILGTASLADLNSRLQEPVEMNRFRPNIVVRTSIPFEEDEWNQKLVGNNPMQIVKPCARCIMTTINQTNLQRGKEPLYALSKYRQVGKNILFGVNAIALEEGGIMKVGDKIAPYEA